MNLPTLPTDNLYKFIALTGLALQLFAFTYPPARIIDLQSHVEEMSALEARVRIQTDAVERKLKRLEAQNSPSPEDITHVRELHEKRMLMAVDLDKSVRSAKRQLAWIDRYIDIAFVSGVVGAVLSWIGFWFWYSRVQRHIDREMIARHDSGA